VLAKRFENSNNPPFLDTLGWLYFKRGDYDQAVPLLRRAHDQMPTAPNFQYHLGAALLKSGQAGEGKTLLRRALESKEVSPATASDAKKLLSE